jgi:hypothetical protein
MKSAEKPVRPKDHPRLAGFARNGLTPGISAAESPRIKIYPCPAANLALLNSTKANHLCITSIPAFPPPNYCIILLLIKESCL